MSQMPGFPHTGFPEGWFAIGWSDEFKTGEIVARRYFREDLAVMRTESGRLSVMSAYCPHMGANLTVGGRVDGECAVCPFHGWHWHADGRNTLIPYHDKPLPAKIRTWPCEESSGLVWLWNSWRAPEPSWPAPALAHLSNRPFYHDPIASRRAWKDVRLVPQMVAENIVDTVHIAFVHLAEEGSHIAAIEEDGPVLNVELNQKFITKSGAAEGKDYIQAHGMGVQVARMEFKDLKVVNVLATTPVEGDRADMRASIFIGLPDDMESPAAASDLPPRLQKLIKSHLDSQEQDLPIWESMRYQPRPLLVGEEVEGQRRFRKWARQFYPPEPAAAG